MRRYPRWGDCVEVMTYWKVKGKVGAVREWTIVDAHTKEVLGTGTSSWVMVNTETRRIARIPQVSRDRRHTRAGVVRTGPGRAPRPLIE